MFILPILIGITSLWIPPAVGPVPEALRKEWKLAEFYQKHIDLDGFPILSSKKVSDQALQEAHFWLKLMLANKPEITRALIKNKVRFAVMAPDEMTTDIPEHSDLTPKDYWDKRARGLGATRTRPTVSCGEENLLNLKGDHYPRENILIHEFSHALHQMGLNLVDRKFETRLRECFDNAKTKELWKGTYAMTNPAEYWAEGVQSYFDANNPKDSQHNGINTREKLAEYDPSLFKLIDEVFQKAPWRYVRYDKRNGTKK